MKRIPTCLAVLMILLALGCPRGHKDSEVAADSEKNKNPATNVVFVTIDTLRQDALTFYGGSQGVGTPHLDNFLSSAISFSEMRTTIPITLPSHLSMFTGREVAYHGIYDNNLLVDPIPAEETLPGVLSSRGYQTAGFVSSKAVNGNFWPSRPFEIFDDALSGPAERPGSETLEALSGFLEARDPGKPLFLWVHLNEPHEPYLPPNQFAEIYGPTYAGEVAATDDLFGRLVGMLKAHHLHPDNSDTIMVFLSDHGEALGEHGEPTHGVLLYDSTLLVPCGVLGMGNRGAYQVSGPTATLDLMPTLLEYLGLPFPDEVEGESLWQGEGLVARKGPLFHESMSGFLHFGWAPLFARTEGGRKLIMAPRMELYDTNEDPSELDDRYLFEKAQLNPLWEEQLKAYILKAESALEKKKSTGNKVDEGLMALGYVWAGGVREGDPKDPKDLIHLSPSIKKAVIARNEGRHLEMLEHAEFVLLEDPDNPAMHRFRAEGLFAQKKIEESYSAALTLIKEFPSCRECVLTSVNVVVNSEGSEEITELVCKAAFGAFPSDPEIAYLVGRGFFDLDNMVESRKAFSRSFELVPKVETQYFLLKISTREGDLDQGMVHMQNMAGMGVPSIDVFKEPWILAAYKDRNDYQDLMARLSWKKNE